MKEQKNPITYQQVFVFVFKDRVSIHHGILKGKKKENKKKGRRQKRKQNINASYKIHQKF